MLKLDETPLGISWVTDSKSGIGDLTTGTGNDMHIFSESFPKIVSEGFFYGAPFESGFGDKFSGTWYPGT